MSVISTYYAQKTTHHHHDSQKVGEVYVCGCVVELHVASYLMLNVSSVMVMVVKHGLNFSIMMSMHTVLHQPSMSDEIMMSSTTFLLFLCIQEGMQKWLKSGRR